jgi:hypothetical protein
VNWYDDKAKSNQKSARLFQNALIFSSAVTPIILVSHFVEHSPWLAGLALISAIANLLITGVMRTYQFDEHWRRYRNVCEDLRAEIHLYAASAHEYRDAQDKRAMFVQRVEEMLSHERKDWQKTSSHRAAIPAGH